MDDLELTGRSRTHVVPLDDTGVAVHRGVVARFRALRAAGARVGLDIALVSAFRDFERQRAIWNAKFLGDRPLVDRDGTPVDRRGLTEEAIVEAILAWSALPGASRHHWGTDLDVYDRAALPRGRRPQLVPAEYASGGPFEGLGGWLAEHMERFGFFRPYDADRGGVLPEPWHLSAIDLSKPFQTAMNVEVVRTAVEDVDLLGERIVLSRLPEMFERYVANVARWAPVSPSRGA